MKRDIHAEEVTELSGTRSSNRSRHPYFKQAYIVIGNEKQLQTAVAGYKENK
jgi:hypothetical protein